MVTRLGRRVLRGLRGLAGLFAVLLLVAVAWLCSNLIDSAPTPRPQALVMPTATLAPEQNLFFALLGITAPVGEQPAEAGRAEWQNQLQRNATVLAERRAGRSGFSLLPSPAVPSSLPRPSGPPWVCPAEADCPAYWLAHTTELTAQLARSEPIGQRCLQAVTDTPRFDEVWASMSPSAPLAFHAANGNLCSSWFNANAVLAAARNDRVAALQWLTRSERLSNALLEGSRTLISKMVAASGARRTWQTMATLGVRDPGLARDVMPLLQAMPAQATDSRRWMVHEAAFQHALVDDFRTDCRTEPDPDHAWAAAGWLDHVVCGSGLGWLPNLSHTDVDKLWLDALASVDAGPVAALSAAQVPEPSPWWRSVAWRNTFSRQAFEQGRTAYAGYLARQADVDLHRQAVALALNVAGLPADQREAAAQAQALSPELRSRLRWADGGHTLLAATFAEQFPGFPQRDAICIAIP